MKKLYLLILTIILFLSGCKATEIVTKNNLTKHNTGILIEYDENIIFNKYDIDILIDDKLIGSISQGEYKLFEVELYEGYHIFTVIESNSKNNAYNTNIDITRSECFNFVCEAKWEGIQLTEKNRLTLEEARTKNKQVSSDAINSDNEELLSPTSEVKSTASIEKEENPYLDLLINNQDEFVILCKLILETYYSRTLSDEIYNDLLSNHSHVLNLLTDIYDYSNENNNKVNPLFEYAFSKFWTDENIDKHNEIKELLKNWTLEYSLITNTWTLTPNPELKPYELIVHYIDVGQGDSVLIESNGHFMLIDAGERNMGPTVTNYLKNQDIQKLDYVLATHPHSDHIGGLIHVLNEFDVDKIIMPDALHTSQTFEDLLDTIFNNNLRITKPVVGNEYKIGSASFTIIAPNSSNYDSLNDYSVGIKLVNGNNAFIFAGDAEVISEKEMLQNGVNISAEVLYINHHGSNSSSHNKYLDAISPTHAIISAGSDNQYGHPHYEVIRSLSERKIKVYRTDKQGTIIFFSDGKELSVNTDPYVISRSDISPTNQHTEENEEIIVHITNTGSKYHRAACRHLKSDIEVTLSEALKKGLSPCKVCNPPTN